ncbi:MAG: SRPBCC domain-containing protein [Acidimicrobiales bacterium]
MPTGLTKDSGWQIGVSRTLPYLPEEVWDLISGREGLALWLGPGTALSPDLGVRYRTLGGVTGEVRGYRRGERIRVTHDATTVQVSVTPANDGAATVLRFHQERMASAQERSRQRAHWQQVMIEVVAALEG